MFTCSVPYKSEYTPKHKLGTLQKALKRTDPSNAFCKAHHAWTPKEQVCPEGVQTLHIGIITDHNRRSYCLFIIMIRLKRCKLNKTFLPGQELAEKRSWWLPNLTHTLKTCIFPQVFQSSSLICQYDTESVHFTARGGRKSLILWWPRLTSYWQSGDE